MLPTSPRAIRLMGSALLVVGASSVAREEDPAAESEIARAAATSSSRATLISVTDGDTLRVRRGGDEESVRIIGIDTPEVYFGVECGGRAASRSMKRMVKPGDGVRLVRDPTQDNRDRYDRLLRYVQRSKRDLGRAQVRRGWAKVYVFEDPFERVRKYRHAKRWAKAGDRGVWGRCGGDFHKPL